MAGARPPVRRSKPDGFELVEAHHIDALTTAVRALHTTITQERLDRAQHEKTRAIREQESAAREERQLAALERIADYTKNLPALMDLLVTKRTNGHGHATDETETT